MKNSSINLNKNIFKCNHKNNSKELNLFIPIDQSPENQLSLKELIKPFVNFAFSANKINIKISINKNIKVNILDDLSSSGLTKNTIEFLLKDNSYLGYNLKAQTPFTENSQIKFDKKLIFTLNGKNSNVYAKCIIKGNKEQLFKISTIQNHLKNNTKSNVLVKGAFLQKSKYSYESLIKISSNLTKVEAYQLNKNLLLGCNSEAISIPKLEVESENVSCQHGSVTSNLNNETLFYLKSKGLTECQAKQMLINAFLK